MLFVEVCLDHMGAARRFGTCVADIILARMRFLAAIVFRVFCTRSHHRSEACFVTCHLDWSRVNEFGIGVSKAGTHPYTEKGGCRSYNQEKSALPLHFALTFG